MTEPLPSDPTIERFKVTPFLTRTEPKEQGAYVIFDDPDYIDAISYSKEELISVGWTTGVTALQAMGVFREELGFDRFNEYAFVRNDGQNRRLIEGRSFRRLERLVSRHDDTKLFSMFGPSREGVAWGPQWPKTFHDIEANEITVHIPKSSKMARATLERLIIPTALPGLRDAMDETLDGMARFIPELKK